MGYGLDGPGSIPDRAGFFSSQRPDRLCGPPSLLPNRYLGLFSLGQGREVKYSSPSSADVKISGAVPPLPL
jgi:hypothetical protein